MCAELFLILFDFSERELAICRRKSASVTHRAVKFACVRKCTHSQVDTKLTYNVTYF